jgi:molybdopterin-dependent oxidoreductase alpha subunit
MIVGGGWKAIRYTLLNSIKIGPYKLWKAMLSKNSCKTCALGMGGQLGGMKNEKNEFPEFCKKSIQAQISDLQAGIEESLFQQKSLAELRQLSPKELDQLGRLAFPLIKEKGSEYFKKLDWDTCLNKIIAQLKKVAKDRSFFYASGRSSNEAAFVLQLFVRLWGTNNINNCSYYCHQASGVGMANVIGTGTATVDLKSLAKADVIFLIGANPSSNHPRFLKELIQCRRRGGKVIIVNPAKENGLVKFAIPSDIKSMLDGGSVVSDIYIQPHIGGDIALLTGIAKWVIENSYCDMEFLEEHTEGFAEWSKSVITCSWGELVEQSGVEYTQIQTIAKIYASADKTVFAWAMGLTHQLFGVENVETIANLALLRGMIAKEGAGLLPLRGHSNVQGIGSMGVTPVLKEAIFKNIEEKLGVRLPTKPGLDTMACIQEAFKGNMDFAFLLGGNLYASNPDTKRAAEALTKIPFQVHLNTTLNQGHLLETEGEVILLPVRTRDEEQEYTTQESMFNFVRMSDGGKPRIPNAKSEMDIITTLAQDIIPTEIMDFRPFQKSDEVRMAIAQVIPGFAKIEELAKSKTEFHIAGRLLKDKTFPTKTGKATFARFFLPENHAVEKQFKLMSIRSEGQYNSIIYEEQDLYRGQKSRNVVLMHPKDISENGYQEGDRVTLKSSVGELANLILKPFDIRRGNVMTYYPEANVLIPQGVDQRSRTPSFKNVAVHIFLS